MPVILLNLSASNLRFHYYSTSKFSLKIFLIGIFDIKEYYDMLYRYYDLRVAVKESKIYSCHALYGMDIVDALEILNRALLSHREEVVILDFQHFYGFEDSHHLFLVDTLYSIFGARLCTPPKDLSHVTLHWLQERGVQVM